VNKRIHIIPVPTEKYSTKRTMESRIGNVWMGYQTLGTGYEWIRWKKAQSATNQQSMEYSQVYTAAARARKGSTLRAC